MMSESAAEAPKVDFPVEPEIPPHPAAVAAKTKASDGVRISVSGPLEQVVSGVGHLRQPANPGVQRRYTNCVQYLAELANDPEGVMHQLEIRRVGPPSWDGEPMPTGVVERVPPLPYPDLFERVRQLHGGGEYRCTVYNGNGQVVQNFPFRIDVLTDPPKIRVGNQTVVAGNSQGPRMILPNGNVRQMPTGSTAASEGEDELTRLRVEERKLAAEQSVKHKKREIEKDEKRWKQEEEQDRERSDTRTSAPVLQQMNALERNVNSNIQAMLMQSQQQFQQLLMSLKDNNKGDDKTVLLLVESMKVQAAQQQAQAQQQTQMFMSMMTAMTQVGQSKSSEHMEAVKMTADANNKIMEMAVKSSQGGNSRYDKMIELMVQQSLTSKNNSVREALDLVKMGREQALELVERDRDDDEISYDPKQGVMGNLGKLIFGMLGGLMKGSGGMAGIASVLQALGKQNAATVNDADLHNLAGVLEKQYQQGGMPGLAGANAPQLPMATAMNPFPQQPQPQTLQQQQAVQQQRQQAAQAVVFEEEPIVQQPQQPQQAVMNVPQPQMQAIQNEPMENRLVDVVSEAMNMAVGDINAGVRDHDWVDFALGKWPKSFLDAIAGATDVSVRIELISQACDPTVFQQLYALLTNERQPESYANFLRALDTLVQDHAEAATAGV
jgi:hypothetical protein